MINAKKKWDIQSKVTEADNLARELQISSLTAHLLCNRGYVRSEDARAFLHTDTSALHDPFLLSGIQEAVNRIETAIDHNERIAVFGDYDVDGVSSTTLMCETLSKLGANYEWYVPNRFTEGYGPNKQAMEKLQQAGCTLIITVDTGIAAHEPLAYAKDKGLDVIVTDHHEVPSDLPEAFAIVNPKKKDCPYPFKELAGVGVVLKLSQALLKALPEDGLDLVVLGTISDLVPLVGENRYLAQRGLQELDYLNRPGLQALKDLCVLNGPPFSAQDVGFGFGPRLNAAGRMDSADPAVKLLQSEHLDEARQFAEDIDRLNRERQETVEEITAAAFKQLELEGSKKEGAIVVAGEGWNSGVTGIVASRLVEKFYRPTIVIALDSDGQGKGSARSIEGFDMYGALATHRELFQRFGGHQMAAGLSIRAEDVPVLQMKMDEEVKIQLSDEDFIPSLHVELEMPIEEISIDVIREMEQLAPFGAGNPKPLVAISRASIHQKRKIGQTSAHLKLQVEQGDHRLECIGFRFGYLDDLVHEQARIELVGELEVNEWKGYEKPQLVIRDAAVKEWQLFDCRSWKSFQQIAEKQPNVKAIVFGAAHETDVLEAGFSKAHMIDGVDGTLADQTDILFYDLPQHLEQLERFLLYNQDAIRSIYAGFSEKHSSFFTTRPTREHFKWFYAYIKQRGPFDLDKHKGIIARHKGWSNDTIDFMTKVFKELEFVTINDGQMSLSQQPLKKDLQESETFRYDEEKRKIEQTLLFSSYADLLAYIAMCMPSIALEEKEKEV